MATEKRQVLSMLADGKLSVEEAERLLEALGQDTAVSSRITESADCCTPKAAMSPEPKFLCVKVDSKTGGSDTVNVKIPLMLVRAGIQLGGVLPDRAKEKMTGALHEKGINLDLKKLDAESINTLIATLSETSIDIEDGEECVKVYCC